MNRQLASATALALLGLGALAFAACGGDDDKGSSTATATKTATSSSSATGSAATATSGSGSATATGTATSSGDDTLNDVLKDTKNATYKITYDLSNTDADGKKETLTYTLVQKPPKSRIEFASATSADDSIILINDGKDSYLCTPSEKSCLKTSGTGGDDLGGALPAVDPETIVQQAEDDGAKVKKVNDRTIAGISATCYEITDSDGTGTMCIAKSDGVVLLLDSTTSDGHSVFTAKSYSKTVNDDDFKPPYKVTDLGDINP